MKGESTQPVKVRSKEVSVAPSVATREMVRATNPSKPRGQRSAWGGFASVRAATRVKPEQASKGKVRAPSPLSKAKADEDGQITDKGRSPCLAGVVGAARTHAVIRNTGNL